MTKEILPVLLRRWEHTALWIGGIAFVIGAGIAGLRLDYLNTHEQFTTRAETARQTVALRLDEGRAIMTSLAALYQASEGLSSTELTSVAQKLLRSYPYFKSVAYLTRVEARERRAFERELRAEAFPGYRIREVGKPGQRGKTAGKRAEYLTVSFLEPLTPATARLMGADILTQPDLAAAARRAIASTGLAVAPVNPLAPESGHLVVLKATYLENFSPTARGGRASQANGAFLMIVDVAAILRDARESVPGLSIDLVAADPDTRARWVALGLTLPTSASRFRAWLSPPHLAGWSHALGDLRFGIRIRQVAHGNDFGGWMTLLALALSLVMLAGFTYWLRHGRHDQHHNLALQERESRLSAVLNTVVDGIITIDENGTIETFNPAAERLFGYPAGEALGQNVRILMPPRESGEHDGYLASYIETTIPRMIGKNRELKAQRADGSRFPIELSLSEARIGQRRIFTGVIRDIGDRKRFEAALKRSEERFRDFAATGSDWFWEIDAELNYSYLSDEYFERFMVLRDQIVGERFGRFCQDQDNPDFQAGMASVEAHCPFRDFRFTVLLPNGVSAEINFNGKPVFGSDNEFEGFRGTATDMTDQRRLEEQITQARRLESIGKLTGGVAHEFNNLLSVIGGFARMAKSHPEDPERLGDAIDTIIQAADQGAQLTRRMLAFSRKQELAPKLVSIAEVVEGVMILLPPLIGEQVKLIVDAQLPSRVRIDPAQLSEAILSLASNSHDAMPKGGVLTISTRLEKFTAPRQFGQRKADPGSYVALTIADTGSGIAPEAMEEIFEPFYTTKDVNQGSGLGLSMVYGLMAQSGGYIDVTSTPGEGCAITLYLPEMADAPFQTAMADGAKRLALVVEANEGTREVTAMTLEEEGFTVIKAAGPDEALRHFEGEPPPVQLLVCGAALPDASGVALSKQLRKKIPALRVIFMIQQGTPEEYEDPDHAEFTRSLQKPIDPELLMELVDQIL